MLYFRLIMHASRCMVECIGEGIEPGDLLTIPCQGAYTYSLQQEFIKPLPRVMRDLLKKENTYDKNTLSCCLA